MPSLAPTVADLTFAYADREAAWLNRYNKDDKSLEWAFKEDFYQKRIRELLVLITDERLEKLHAIIKAMFEQPAGEAMRRRSPAATMELIGRFRQACEDPASPDTEAPHE
ncbi:hypothetical protein [Prosthecobacter sp.]|jgi:hypothetical protein|uniref:hypothetical protein n=1 Tax=Prosthecobacter sp. TaxID=1965333 RepID=UPI0037848964